MKRKRNIIGLLRYFGQNLLVMIGIVMIWRGVWVLLDIIDARFFGGDNVYFAAATVAGGLLVLYLPDKDLDEIKKL